MSDHVKIVSDANFEVDVLQSTKPVLVDFWAPWCGPCRTFAPVFETEAAERQEVVFAKLNVDDSPITASKYGVMSIPTIILFENGQVAGVNMGSLSKSALSAFIESNT